jgi:uncharacterized protein
VSVRERLLRRLGGHWWTLEPFARDRREPVLAPRAERFHHVVADVSVGPVALTGNFHDAPHADTVVVVLHGVGGDITSHYMRRAARAAHAVGMASLTMNMRGADMSGADFYHAGLTADLHAVLASPRLASFSRVAIVGYSFGGHVAMRYALDRHDARLTGVVAICAPLDLSRAARDIDQPSKSLYRGHILRSLKGMARASHARRGLPVPLGRVAAIQHLRSWDELLTATRFRFADAEDYYARVSVARDLHRLTVPTLLVATPDDPMVQPASIEPGLAGASDALLARWVEGGHVGFPPDVDLGENAPPGLEEQAMAWLARQGS